MMRDLLMTPSQGAYSRRAVQFNPVEAIIDCGSGGFLVSGALVLRRDLSSFSLDLPRHALIGRIFEALKGSRTVVRAQSLSNTPVVAEEVWSNPSFRNHSARLQPKVQ